MSLLLCVGTCVCVSFGLFVFDTRTQRYRVRTCYICAYVCVLSVDVFGHCVRNTCVGVYMCGTHVCVTVSVCVSFPNLRTGRL